MESPEKKVAIVSRTRAERYFQRENFGRAFAHLLLALKLCPNWKSDMKGLFTFSLCNWGKELEEKGRYYDLFNCYEQALEVFPDNEEIVNNLGAHLFRSGHIKEASFYFDKALKIKPDYLPAYRNLQSVSNLLVERWHFRMLNDAHRNEAYREAIFKKVGQGFDFVLDIGSGTGLLSYFAVDSGSHNVFACDYSRTMIDTAQKISEVNGLKDDIKFICKLSNNLGIPDDIPRRVSLVVTETMDAGLFGEHLLQTLLHAWNYLLLPPLPPSSLVPPVPCIICRDVDLCKSTRRNGIVLPLGASLWFAAVECSDIGQKYRVVSNKRDCFEKVKFPFLLTSKFDEPYNCENLKNCVNNFKFLCEPVNCFYVNFNDVNELQDFFNGKYDNRIFNVQCSNDGVVDCFVFWFDLYLDEDIKLSSSPLVTDEYSDLCCWDQAIFPFFKEVSVSSDSSIELSVKTRNGILGLDVVDVHKPCSLFPAKEILSVSPEVIRFLNCNSVMKSFNSVVSIVTKSNILDFSPFPMLYFNILSNVSSSNVYLSVAKTENEISAIKKLAVASEINLDRFRCISERTFDNDILLECNTFDFIVTNLIDPCGELKENSVAQLPKLRKLLKPDGKILPEKIIVWGQLISSKSLRRSSEVLSEGVIEKFDVAEFINKYKASQQLDLCIASLEHEVLSEEFEILQISINELLENTCKEFHCNIPVVATGEATAILYWFNCQLLAECVMFSTKERDSHINQVAFMIEQNHHVTAGDHFKLKGKFSDAGLMFMVE